MFLTHKCRAVWSPRDSPIRPHVKLDPVITHPARPDIFDDSSVLAICALLCTRTINSFTIKLLSQNTHRRRILQLKITSCKLFPILYFLLGVLSSEAVYEILQRNWRFLGAMWRGQSKTLRHTSLNKTSFAVLKILDCRERKTLKKSPFTTFVQFLGKEIDNLQ
jgi:hypothetical protein